MWLSPSVSCKFGAYFQPDPAEQKTAVESAQAARGKGSGLTDAQPLITRRQAVELVAPVFGIENIDATMEALEEEDAENEQKAADAAAAEAEQQRAHIHELAGGLNDDEPAKPKGAGRAGGKDKKASGSDGGGSSAAPAKET